MTQLNLKPNAKLNLKPAHKSIKDYYATLQEYSQQAITHEGAVSAPFGSLLNTCAKQIDATFSQQYQMQTDAGNRIVIDGAVTKLGIPLAYWEAKDIHDDLPRAIRQKQHAGYPQNNILYQTPERGILIQNGQKTLDTDLTDPNNLINALQHLFSYTTPVHEDWERAVTDFRTRIPDLATEMMNLIQTQYDVDATFKSAFNRFYQTCRSAINPNLSRPAIEEMLTQHILTERIFRTVFHRSDFTRRNIIAKEIENVTDALMRHAVSRDDFLQPLDQFYVAIENAAKICRDFSQKQHLLNTFYEQFFQGFSEDVADTHGIVYTPQPIVDFMVNSVSHILETDFGRSLSDTGVHIIDPFVGTGNFIVRLMQDIQGTALEAKYRHELHCNEVMLLPYYIASLNIEQEYYQRTQQYLPFEGIALADTFELLEGRQMQLLTQENTERVEKQKKEDMFVVIGNPPYNAGQVNENNNNKNRKYETMDKRIKDTYADDSTATLKNKLYDPYVRAIRWASDRIGEEGVVAFITNNSFVNGVMFDGMRKHLSQDFDAIYVLDLGGNARKGVKVSDANVFGIRVGVSINLFIKKKHPSEAASLFYHRTDDAYKKDKKFYFLNQSQHVGNIEWKAIQPHAQHTWLTEGLQVEYDNFIPMGTKEIKNTKRQEVSGAIFRKYSLGVSTNRDAWVYNFNQDALRNNVQRTIEAYIAESDRWERHKKPPTKKLNDVDVFVMYEDDKISWSSTLKRKLQSGQVTEYTESKIRHSVYRPFTKTELYFDKIYIDRPGLFPSIFPTLKTEKENRVICLPDKASEKIFSCLITDCIPNLVVAGGFGSPSQCFPFYIYDEDGTNRRENITDWALAEFRKHYGDDTITKWDIFHYIYALLHHPMYREKYQANLKRDLPHIPLSPRLRGDKGGSEDFWGFANAGAQLADIHVNYESQPKYDGLKYIETPDTPVDWRVEKMKLSKDKTQLKYNDFLTIDGIPAEVFAYRLGTRSALEWVIDQYRVKTDKRSGIVNDPNRVEEPQYIVHLIGQIITVSLKTNKIVDGLPAL